MEDGADNSIDSKINKLHVFGLDGGKDNLILLLNEEFGIDLGQVDDLGVVEGSCAREDESVFVCDIEVVEVGEAVEGRHFGRYRCG